MANVGKKTIEGRVVLLKKNVLDVNDLGASVLDRVHELLGQKVTLQLISAYRSDHQSSGVSSTSSPITKVWSHAVRFACCVSMTEERSSREKVGKPAILEDWFTTIAPLTVGESSYKVTFEWDDDMVAPGAFLVQNNHHSEFYLKTLTLDDVPGHGQVHFVCNSWVYPTKRYAKDRVFFTNKAYLPGETPEFLRSYRQGELEILRGESGDGTGMLKEWDRVYDYAFYNDLGDPDKNVDDARPVLGGSSKYPYPRRGRTGRPPSKSDPNTESRLPLVMSLNIYVPRDERFEHLKLSDFLAYGLKSIAQFLVPEFEALFDSTFDEFDSFEDVMKIYEGGFKLPKGPFIDRITEKIHLEMLRILLETDNNTGLAKYPKPQIIQDNKSAWRTDAEFAREMLAGVNPVTISLLKEFPPISKLDVQVYGNQNSSIERHHIEQNLNGLKVEEVLKANRLFILDHHDSLMPYLRRINEGVNKIYASRTLLLLQEDGTLIPLAIELSLPHPEGDNFGPISNVYTPAQEGVEGSVWQLAKAYVAVNDSGIHQLISHWLNTHAVVEPFVIAANRQLSVLHPIYKLLYPHFRDTMNINAFARQILINGGGILEKTVFPGKYSMELSSVLYKDWVFPEQALPADLVKRGMAVVDSNSQHGIRLLIEDYPYAVDGLEIWSAIKSWVEDYCKFYYTNDDMVRNDVELQSWWKELREVGHGDKKHESWWPEMDSCQALIGICTTFIWVASALHAAVNYGQYPYAGFLPNRPTLSRRFMPEPNTPEYDELKQNPEKVFLKTITPQLQTLLGIALIELLSRHPSDEVYLGQRECPEWTLDAEPLKAFGKFGNKLKQIEERIEEMNTDERMKNRVGQAKVAYTLLYPTSEEGLTGKGIPNSTAM